MTRCFRLNPEQWRIDSVEYVGDWPPDGEFVNGIGGMEGVANRTAFLTEERAREAWKAFLIMSVQHHTGKAAQFANALKRETHAPKSVFVVDRSE